MTNSDAETGSVNSGADVGVNTGGFSDSPSPAQTQDRTQGSAHDSISAAFERAEQRVNEANRSERNPSREESGKQPTGDSAPPSSEQAARASQESPGDSTPAPDGTDTPGSGENDGTSGQSPGDSTPGATQSLTPPDSWPKERREQFSSLPEQGKALLLDIQKDMERGLKQSFDKLANERKQLTDRFGLEADQIQDLAQRAQAFQSDPVKVISQLADEAGIEVFFNRDTDEIPEFDSQADLVKWLRQQSQNEARQAAANEAKALKQQQHQAEVKARMEQEFAEAYRAHPDLADHKDAVIHYISGFNVPVEMAYRLATWEGLMSLAGSGQSTQAELAKARAELENLQKLATMPPGRADGRTQKPQANGHDPFEAAFDRAMKGR